MTINVVPLASGVGTGSLAVVLGPVEVNQTNVIRAMVVNNTTSGAIVFTVTYNDPTARELISVRPLATKINDPCLELKYLTLRAGQSLSFNAPAGVTFAISGLVVV